MPAPLPLLPLLALALAAPAAGGADGGRDDRVALAAAEERWAAHHVVDYSYRVRVRCFCPPARFVRVRVRDGVPGHTPRRVRDFDTVDELFDELRREIRRNGEVEVRYGKRHGVPRRFALEGSPDIADDERFVEIRDVRITRRDPG